MSEEIVQALKEKINLINKMGFLSDNLVKYDIAFMIVFIIAVIFFLYKKRENLNRQGWIYLYHSTKGISFMRSFAKRFEKILRPMQYLVVACGYFLLIGIVWLLGATLYRYIVSPEIVEIIKAPPIAPVIPYFPALFGLESLFPPLYFTYFIVVLAIVAVVHEFAHGIFAKLNNVRIKTTGFAFLGPILGAFVEQDDKQMNRAKKFPQLAILAAGTFANVVFTIIFGIILGLFFMASFAPAGINFNSYPSEVISLESIDFVENIGVDNLNEIIVIVENNSGLLMLNVGNNTYFASGSMLKRVIEQEDVVNILVFQDAPAVRSELRGPILTIDGEKITSPDKLTEVLRNYNPGDEIIIESIKDDERVFYNITLGDREGNAYLGIGMNYPEGLQGLYFNFIANSRNTGPIYYGPIRGGDFTIFVYYLLWWIVLINFLVALFNMLPLGILDGGRFFYITIWGITGKEEFGRAAYKFATWTIVMIFVLMMFAWFVALL